MRKTIFATCLTLATVIAAAPVLAQSAASPTAQVPGGPAPGTIAPTVPAPGPTPVTPNSPPIAPPSAAPTPAAPSPGQVTAFLNAQFPSADTNGDGQLSREEFIPWVTQLRQQQSARSGASADGAEAGSYASNAFARADVDSNNVVTRTELSTFLGG